MARTEQLQLEIELSNGQKAGNTLKDLGKNARDLKRELNGLAPGTKAFTDKSKDLQKVNGRIKDIKGEISGTSKNMKDLAGQFGIFGPFQGLVNKGTAAVKFLAGGFKTLRGAIISTGIGALVVALGALVTWLTTTQAGMDKVTAVMRPLQAIMSRTLGVIQELGGKAFKALGEAIKNPIGTLRELGQVLLDNVINRFKAFALIGPAIAKILSGELTEGLSELGDAAIQMGTGVEDGLEKIKNAANDVTEFVKDGIDAGTRIDELTKQIERSEISLTKNRAILNQRYNEAKEIAQDLSKSESERIKAARDAQAAQNSLLNQEQSFLDLKIEKTELEQKLNDTSREQELELAALEAERTQFAATAAKKRASAKSLENTALAQISAQRVKRLKEEQKAENELLTARAVAQDAIEKLQLSLLKDGLEKRIGLLNLAAEKELQTVLENDKLTAEQRSEQTSLLELQLKQNTDKLIEDEEKKHQAELTKIQKEEFEKQNDAIELSNQEQANIIAENGINALISIQTQQALELELALEFEQKKLDLLIASGNATELEIAAQNARLLAAQKSQADAEAATIKESEDKKQAIRQETFAIASDLLSLADGLESKNKQTQKKIIAAQQAVAIANVIISTQQEIAGYLAHPANGASFGVAGGIKSAIAVARAAISIKKITSQKPKFALGGRAIGASHQSGGINMVDNQTGRSVGEMEGDELILSKGVYRNPVLRAYASEINALGGGRRFALGGPINPISSGTQQININTSSQKTSNTSTQDLANANIESNQQIVNAIDRQTDSINTWNRNIKVINDPRDTEDALQVVNEIQESVNI